MGEKGIGITPDTKIVFTVKSFFGLIGSILAIFFAFYTVIIVPKFEDIESSKNNSINEIKESVNNINIQLMEMNNGIGALNGHIEGINNRFNDLNSARNSSHVVGGL